MHENKKTSLQKPTLFKRFLHYYKGQRHLFIVDTICAFGIAAIDLAFPQILRTLTGSLFLEDGQTIKAALIYLAAGLIAMYAIRFVCRYFVIYWGHVMGMRMETHMREDLFDSYQRMSLSYFDKNKIGDLMSRMINDLFDISEAAHHGPEYLLIGAVEIIGSFIILGFINLELTLVLAAILFVLIIFDIQSNKKMRAAFTKNQQTISGVNTRLEDSLAGVNVVKSFAAEDIEKTKFHRSNRAYLDSKSAMYHVMARYQSTVSAMLGLLYTVIVVMGGYLIAQGRMQAIDLASYALYITLFTTPVQQILDFTEIFQKGIAGFKRFSEVMGMSAEIEDKDDAKDLCVTQGTIEYRHVSFSYKHGESDEVIHDLTLEIKAGQTLALVGPSGGGKSTICALLPRFYDVDQGSILIDGQDVRDVKQQSLRRQIGLVQQDVYLFDGTIEENIAYGNPSASIEDVRLAAKQAHIDEFIESLPEGYKTEVGERGARLSGGQRQRIAIARVFLKNPPLLIFDEATSALDNESERAVQQSLADLAKNRTTVIIAHRLSTIMGADEIVAIEEGRAVERGTHEQLLAKNGLYARYYRMQFQAPASCADKTEIKP